MCRAVGPQGEMLCVRRLVLKAKCDAASGMGAMVDELELL
jgi:hypothetical protein